MIRSVGWPQGGYPALMSKALHLGQAGGEVSSRAAGGLATARSPEWRARNVYLAGRSKPERWQSELLLPTCDSKNVSQKHVWGLARGTKV